VAKSWYSACASSREFLKILTIIQPHIVAQQTQSSLTLGVRKINVAQSFKEIVIFIIALSAFVCHLFPHKD